MFVGTMLRRLSNDAWQYMRWVANHDRINKAVMNIADFLLLLWY